MTMRCLTQQALSVCLPVWLFTPCLTVHFLSDCSLPVWLVNGLYVFSAFLVISTSQSTLQVSIHPFICSRGRWLLYKEPTCSLGTHSHTFTHQWRSHKEQFGAQYLAQGHFDMPLYLLSHSFSLSVCLSVDSLSVCLLTLCLFFSCCCMLSLFMERESGGRSGWWFLDAQIQPAETGESWLAFKSDCPLTSTTTRSIITTTFSYLYYY